MAAMLGVPVQELWEKIPGVTQQDLDHWKASVTAGDPIRSLEALLNRVGISAANGAPCSPATNWRVSPDQVAVYVLSLIPP